MTAHNLSAQPLSRMPRYADPRWAALFYLLALIVAETATTFVNPVLGLVLHVLILVLLLLHAAFTADQPVHGLLTALLICPLIRLFALSLPLLNFPVIYWYLIVSLPLFIAAYFVARQLGYSWRQVGFTLKLRGLPFHLIVIVLGGLIGFIEYAILRPDPIIDEITWEEIVLPAISLIIGTGFMEEVVFRGLIQQSGEKPLGRVTSVVYSAAIFAALHIGWQSIIDLVFVFLAGLLWGWVFYKTRSVIWISLSHGATNIVLFLVLPLVIPHP
jgi:hypothetical protein